MKTIQPVLLFVLLAIVGCAEKRDDITNVSSDDHEMISAMQKARSTVEKFWIKRNKDGEAFHGWLKVYFPDPSPERDGEHMWVEVVDRASEEITGILRSRPGWLTNIKEGDTISFQSDRISDWLYVEDGIAKGAFTMNLLRLRMSERERLEHDSGYSYRFE